MYHTYPYKAQIPVLIDGSYQKRTFTSNDDVWAVIEWECCIKSPVQGATEGAKIIQDLIINCTDKKFDDFAGGKTNDEDLRNILNI